VYELTQPQRRRRSAAETVRAKKLGVPRTRPPLPGTSTAKVLVAYDGTAPGAKAFLFACDLARSHHAELHVLGTVRMTEIAADKETQLRLDRARRRCEKLVRDMKPGPGGRGVAPHVEVAAGAAADQILLYAQRNNVAHIVVGYRQRARFSDWLFSVAREVTIFAPCTVTVVRS